MIMNGTIEIVCYSLVGLVILLVVIGAAFGDTIRRDAEEERINKYYGDGE